MKKYFILFLIVFLFIKLEKARELRKRRHSFLLPAVFDFAPFEFGLDSGIDDLLDSNFRNFQKFAEERLKKIDLRNSTNSTGLIHSERIIETFKQNGNETAHIKLGTVTKIENGNKTTTLIHESDDGKGNPLTPETEMKVISKDMPLYNSIK